MAVVKIKMLPQIPVSKIQFDVDWKPQTKYYKDTLVRYEGNLYLSLLEHTTEDSWNENNYGMLITGAPSQEETVTTQDVEVTQQNQVLEIPITPVKLSKLTVLKANETDFEYAIEEKPYLEQTDYSFKVNQNLTLVTLTFFNLGNYKVIY